jgi:hypothetical protein
MTVSTNILVPGRAQNHLLDGSLELSESGIARVDTAVAYFEANRDAFAESLERDTGGIIAMAGGYAALASSGRMQAPPYRQREGTQMYERALDCVPPQYLANVPTSTSTLENILSVHESGLFMDVSPYSPMGVVVEEHTAAEGEENGQYSQWARVLWFVRRVYKLPSEAVILIPTPTRLSDAEQADERKLMRATRLLYGPAHTANGLRRAEKIAGVGARVLTGLGLQKPPAENYAQLGNN